MADVAGGRTRSELALRVASALVLIPFALFVVHQGGVWLAVGSALFAGVMGFEWCRMAAQGPVWLAVPVLAVINLAFFAAPAAWVCGALGVFALIFGALPRIGATDASAKSVDEAAAAVKLRGSEMFSESNPFDRIASSPEAICISHSKPSHVPQMGK